MMKLRYLVYMPFCLIFSCNQKSKSLLYADETVKIEKNGSDVSLKHRSGNTVLSSDSSILVFHKGGDFFIKSNKSSDGVISNGINRPNTKSPYVLSWVDSSKDGLADRVVYRTNGRDIEFKISWNFDENGDLSVSVKKGIAKVSSE